MKPLAAMVLSLVLLPWAAIGETRIDVTYLHVETPRPPVLSNLDPEPADLGLAGAQLAVRDNATTGRFLGHAYTLDTVSVALGEDPLAAARRALSSTDLLVLDAPAEVLLAIADLPEAARALIFNTSAEDTDLRGQNCRANILHSAPSLAMRTDALAQFLAQRRWTRLAMIEGSYPADKAFAAALERSARKFGLKIGARKTWAFDADMRRHAAQEVPLFTQDLGKYDALLVADETGDFGRYIAYNTWLPRPVVGSEGLTAAAWAPVVEQWGAAQLQSRFHEMTGRQMYPQDYAAWAALRSIGEAVTRGAAGDAPSLHGFLMSGDFELAGFKGRPLTYRAWNGQLRQPIPLTQPRALVTQAPLEGFLHPRTELDTLGLDAPEAGCAAYAA
ncbi:ABC transporter substrate-binding protein [Fluviibacterium sp. DFM31]|uniref:ABC transporter substrate-binding protein n=1 Tax=Meridianimarinicoccus marinus TaxID=3231483 RepID=A0ABV3L957_9RHOB